MLLFVSFVLDRFGEGSLFGRRHLGDVAIGKTVAFPSLVSLSNTASSVSGVGQVFVDSLFCRSRRTQPRKPRCKYRDVVVAYNPYRATFYNFRSLKSERMVLEFVLLPQSTVAVEMARITSVVGGGGNEGRVDEQEGKGKTGKMAVVQRQQENQRVRGGCEWSSLVRQVGGLQPGIGR